MIRILRIYDCERCPHSTTGRGCNHPKSLWVDEYGIERVREFTDYPKIPDWCELELDPMYWD